MPSLSWDTPIAQRVALPAAGHCPAPTARSGPPRTRTGRMLRAAGLVLP